MNIVFGIINSYDDKSKLLSIKKKKRVYFYLVPKPVNRLFSKYILPGRFIVFKSSDKKITKGNLNVIKLESIIKVINPHRYKTMSYYDLNDIQDGIKKLINKEEYKIFLDLEMNMNPFYKVPNFKSEIIQAGIVITDKEDKVILEKKLYIKPVLFKLTKRSTKKLFIFNEDFENAITYKEFHDYLYNLISKYNSKVFVWGKNDFLSIELSNTWFKVDSNIKREHFVNLLQLHRTYYSLSNDIGLFRCLSVYKNNDIQDQAHDALEDALVTKEIFNEFKKITNTNKTITF